MTWPYPPNVPRRPPPERWLLLPPDVLVVLHGEPVYAGEIRATFRPDIGITQTDRAMTWARARATEYALGRSGDVARDGARWEWDNFHALHILFGRRAEINGGS